MKPPTREQVQHWINTGEWRWLGVDPRHPRALGEAYLLALDVVEETERDIQMQYVSLKTLKLVRRFREGTNERKSHEKPSG